MVPPRAPLGLRGYDMDASSTSLEQHERAIHALRSGAGRARVKKVRSRVRVLPYLRHSKILGTAPVIVDRQGLDEGHISTMM